MPYTQPTQKNEELIAFSKTLKGTARGDSYERMISGLPYNAVDPTLLEARHRGECFLAEYNGLDPRSGDYREINQKRTQILEAYMGSIGEKTLIVPPLRVEYGANISIGSETFINFNFVVNDVGIVKIGNRVMIGPNVSLMTPGHPTSALGRLKEVEWGLLITIEDNVWIGAGAMIMAGVTVGKGSVIGAGAIVTKDVPEYSLALGFPAKVVRKLQTVQEELADENNPYRDLEGEIPAEYLTNP